MKAAPRYPEQIRNRIAGFAQLGLPAVIELHLFGLEELHEGLQRTVEACRAFEGVEYIVHIPLTDKASGYIFDVQTESGKHIRAALDLCTLINAKELVLHRCFGFDKGFTKAEAERGFQEKVRLWDGWAREKGVHIVYENYGFVWLPQGLGKDHLVSPLDHFFPWDMAGFTGFVKKNDLKNTGMLLDLAHACLSANMFNLLKADPGFSGDPRFGNIYPEDLARSACLRVEDFLVEGIEYFHVSDAYVWQAAAGVGDVKKYLYTEGLPVGKGTIGYPVILDRLKGGKTLVMEIEPEHGDHVNNQAQLTGAKLFRDRYFKEGEFLCA